MIILISGSVGSGKTFISKKLGDILNFKVVHLNEIAKDFKLDYDSELETFDFDLDKLLDFVENKIKEYRKKGENVILEGHFAHFIDFELVDLLFIISKDIVDLKKEYEKRGYGEKKIRENLDVEILNLCFFEAIDNGYVENKNLYLIENKNDFKSIEKIVSIIKKI